MLCAPATRDTVAGLADDLGIPGVICLGQDITIPGACRRGRGTSSACGPPRRQTPQRCCSAAAPPDFPKLSSTRTAALPPRCAACEHIWPTRADGEVFLPIAPFTHIYGFLAGVLVPLSARGETVIPERFQPEHIVELLARHRVTFFGGGPPAIYAGLLAARNLGSADLSALRVCPAGGAPFPVELMERWRRATGLEIYEGYGMSEMAPISGTDRAVRTSGQARSASRCLAPKCKSSTWTPGFACCRQARRASCGSAARI